MRGRENLCSRSVVCTQEGIVFRELLFIYLKTDQQYLLNTNSFLGSEYIMQSKINLLGTLIMIKFEISRDVNEEEKFKSAIMSKSGLRSGAA